ncbi:MAG TPA: acyl-CoA dehydrogenase family protein [Vicinamibacteria bacterium]|nr:acyl-CoA dehydrogenase family protein [Vicinamibacteria bacterium]
MAAAGPPPEFLQDPPRLTNTFEADPALRDAVERLLPSDLHARLLPAWRDLGEAAAGPLADLAREAESDPPRHVPYDAWGRRVDEIRVSPAWHALHRAAAQWGLTAIPYERDLGPFARVHQFALLALYGPSSAVYTCHLAMTDGAARTLLEHADPALSQRVVPHLISRDPDQLWTSGQWMTERSGGSDVSGTATVARHDGGAWRLWGTKWFTSAVTSEVALTLARPEGSPEGSAGLSLFLVEQRRADGTRNGIRILRLKDKLGTRALPTAELALEGCLAEPVGDLGRGVKKITPLLNITRLHNAISACGMMARLLQLLRDYARRRVAFGSPLARKALHRETLATLQVEYEAALALTFDCARLLGKAEAGEASEEERATLRLLTPLCKLLTARQAVAVASEALEGFGGPGYVEDTGLPVWLRDAQVLPIWEGTTNVLSLDALRAVAREGVLEPWTAQAARRLEALASSPLAESAREMRRRIEEVPRALGALAAAGPDVAESAGRRIALSLAGLSAAVALAEQGAWALAHGRGERAALAAERWRAQRVPELPSADEATARLLASAALSGLTD